MPRLLGSLVALLLSTAAFAQSADVRIDTHGNLNRREFSMLMAILNEGPDVARNAVLTIDVPPGLTVKRATVGSNTVTTCDPGQRPIRCAFGDLRVGLPPYYGGLDIDTPVANATYTITATIATDTPDPNAKNNTVSLTFNTSVEADLEMRVQTEVDRLDPRGTATYTANVCNWTRENQPPTVRVEFTATNGTIEGMKAATGFTCLSEGSKVVCTIAELTTDCAAQPFQFTLRASDDRKVGKATVTAVATGDVPDHRFENNTHTHVMPVYRWIPVTTTADAGPGSLREAIAEANVNCTPGPCRIVFEIPKPVPDEGWFTIVPATPLPSITAERVTLEGNRQTEFTGNTNARGPEIAIDGRLAHRGLRMLATCEGVVNGLAIGNFDEDQGLWISTGAFCGGRRDTREVSLNHIGTDPTGEVPWPNRRGLRLDFASPVSVTRNVISHNRFSGIWAWRGALSVFANLIEFNGASGVFVGDEVYSAAVNDNVIRQNAQMGIAAALGALPVQMRRNIMKDNGGLGIDWGLDGVSPIVEDDDKKPSNAPLMLSATYDPATDRTTVNVQITSKPLGPYFNYGYLDMYANDKPDGDGERFLGAINVYSPSGTHALTFLGDLRGKWINATWTREHIYALGTPGGPETQNHDPGFVVSTSELSNSVLVQ